jgi:photosystem II stability/assembly factor-like uncharacterized protein
VRSRKARFVALAALAAGALIPCSGVASAAVSSGHSGWSWGNPVPQGNDIQGLELIGNRGYAAGKFGTLLRTDDAGASWTGIATGITQDLARVRIIDSDSLVIAGGCALRRSDDAGQSFTRLPWTASDLNCPSAIVSLSFPSDQVGYLSIANGTVFRTADGGKTWSRKTAVPGTPATGGSASPTDIFFTATDTGVVSTTAGQIYRTTDGAGSWTLVRTHSQAFNGLFFVDANSGYAVGNASSVFKTIDGGATWTEKQTGNLKLTSIRCADAATCLATVDSGDRVLRTTDGADSFSSVTPSTDKIFAAAFASPTRAIAAGAFGTTVVSNDAGATWSAVGGRLAATLRRLRVTSSSLAFAPGRDGVLARTTDGGASWGVLGVSTSQDVIDASFPNQSVGYALDSAGSVLRTGNSGASWQILNTGTTAKPVAILALDPNNVILIGPRGVRRSSDGGGEFSLVKGKAVAKASLVDFDRVGSAIFAYGFKALIVSTNGGKSWKTVRRPARIGLEAVDFVSRKAGFALTLDGRVWQSRNGGRKWREVSGIGNDSAFDLSFSSVRRGWAAIREFGGAFRGYVLRTSDGGKTWRPQLVDDHAVAQNGLVATGDNTGLLLSEASSLFATGSGGDTGNPSTLTLKTKKRTLRKKGTIKVAGKLRPAEGGEQVVVSMRAARLVSWRSQVATVASNGTFTTTWKVSNTSLFIGQWSGDDDHAGDGSKLLTVTVGRRR